MKTKLLSLLALMLTAVSGAWAQTTYSATLKEGTEDAANWSITPTEGLNENDQVTIKYSGSKMLRSVKVKKVADPLSLPAATTPTVTFKANGNTKVVENVTLPKTFSCDYEYGNGELDLIIKELYGLTDGYCASSAYGTPSSSGSENVTCGLDGNGESQFITISAPFEGTATVTGVYFNSDFLEFGYSIEITAPNNEVTITPVDGNTNEWTFQMPASNVEVEVKYYNSILDFPLTLEAKTAGKIYVQDAKQGMQYRLNDGAKTLVDPNGEGWIEISLSEGDKVEFYGDGTRIDSYYGTQIFAIDGNNTADVYIYGNIMSLVDEENYETATAFGGRAFSNLFDGSTHLYSHPTKKLVLPATTLTLACYDGMFAGCTQLTTAPELPATTLAENCYSSMFNGCSSLTTAPVLPAEKVENSSYYFMFKGCTKLNSVTCLATDISAYGATTNWLNGVASTGTFTKAAGMKDWSSGDSGIPSGWTVTSEGSDAPTTYSASVNIEQLVLDNGVKYDITKDFIDSYIEYASINALDTLNDLENKAMRNEPYLGLKLKTTGAYIKVLVKKGSTLNVKLGAVKEALGVSINGTAKEAIAATDEGTTYSYEATEADAEVTFTTASNKTVVFKQIMIDEPLADVTLPEPGAYLITVATPENGTAAVNWADKKYRTPVGAEVTVTATPAEGYELEAITVTGATSNTAYEVSADGKFTMPNEEVTVSATFKEESYVKLSDYAFDVNSEFIDDPDYGKEIEAKLTYKSELTGSYQNEFTLNATFNYEVVDKNGTVVTSGTQSPFSVSYNVVTIYIDGLEEGTEYTIRLTSAEVTDFDVTTFEEKVVFNQVTDLSGAPLASYTFTTQQVTGINNVNGNDNGNDNVNVKVIKDGKIVIYRNGAKYTVGGKKIK